MATKKTPQAPSTSQRGNLQAPRRPATAGVTGGQMQPITRGSGTQGGGGNGGGNGGNGGSKGNGSK
jgi:hypothetical protein